MAEPFEVAVLIGSLREASLTRKVAAALMDAEPRGIRCRVIEIGDLQIYNEDLDDSPPMSWTRFRSEVAAVQAVLILTPEYNRSIPACLKNALEIGSRPQGKNIWDGKPAGVVSVTPYKMGAFGANHHVRQALVYLNMPAMQQPEAYIGGAADLFDDDGNLANEETRRFLKQFMAAFEQWVTTLLGARPGPDFPDLMKQRERIAAAYCNGDSGPLDAIVTEMGTTTFFPPLGGVVTGAKEVKARYDKDVDAFSPGAKSSLEVINSGTSRQLVFWTGIQDFQGEIYGQATTMKLRITEVFRLIEGEWKLVHRHADPAVDVPTRSNKT